MDDLRQATIDTYNSSAQTLANYFKGIGPRTENIDMAFKEVGNPLNAKVVEIGCGDGRDAAEIIKHTNRYQGFDISDKLIEIARKTVPYASFTVADVVNYNFPDDIDILFAFASLLHIDKEEVGNVLARAHKALKPKSIFYISLKYADTYVSTVKEDQYGKRLFYFYNVQIIDELAANQFDVTHTWRVVRSNTEWVEIILRNK